MNQMTPHDRASESLSFLMESLERVLSDLGETDVVARLPWSSEATADVTLSPQDVRAYSIALQLLAIAEENAVAQNRRTMERQETLAQDAGSLDQVFARLADRGLGGEEIARALRDVEVEVVLTAHPTEAKRRTVLTHHRSLYRVLVELENSMFTDAERAAYVEKARAVIEQLWRTGEVHLVKPTVEDERDNALHYLANVFPHVLPRLQQRLRDAWARAGFSAEALEELMRRPGVAFGDWVGGDRDGHPFVSATTTAETLALFRAAALRLQRDALEALGRSLSLSKHRTPPPEALLSWITDRAHSLGDRGRDALARNADEPFRQAINLILASLPPSAGEHPAGVYTAAAELCADLNLVRAWLVEVGAERIARVEVDPAIGRAQVFGFHLARLDIRQNSAYHDRAIAQMLTAIGHADGARFAEWPSEQRHALIAQEIETLRPFLAPSVSVGSEADDLRALYAVLRQTCAAHGADGIGTLIVSMTRSAQDLFAVYLFAREAGLLEVSADGPYLPLEVTPLLETIDDLERAEDILETYLSAPIVQRSLAAQAEQAGWSKPRLQVMVGYSDSGKDGGPTASFWALYKAQSRIVALAARHGVEVTFFHGRGGSIGRGAGPTHRFLAALPPGSVSGKMRLTEQGETVSAKYANQITAAHHLELLLAGSLAAKLEERTDHPDLLEAMDLLAQHSFKVWRDLVETDGFLDFFGQATPIDLIEQSRHGSRPSRRTGRRTLADLRAIPWVFSWNQSRFMLPGFYGFGSALAHLRDTRPDLFDAVVVAKAEATRWSPIHFLVSNTATAWARGAPDLMHRYAGLVQDRAIADRFVEAILTEHTRTGEMIAEVYGAPIAQARPAVFARLARRHQALVPLHGHQITLLRDWRALQDDGQFDRADEMLPEMFQTVNAIAAGLGATG